MKSILIRCTSLAACALIINPGISFGATQASAIMKIFQDGGRDLGVAVPILDSIATPEIPASAPAATAKRDSSRSMPDAIRDALRRAGPSAKAADVLAAAGYALGSLKRKQVLDAFRGVLNDAALRDLEKKLNANFGEDRPAANATVESLAVASIAGNQYACIWDGCIVEIAAVVAAVVALSGCENMDRLPMPIRPPEHYLRCDFQKADDGHYECLPLK